MNNENKILQLVDEEDLKGLSTTDQKILTAMITMEGKTNSEIGEIAGVTKEWVSERKNTEKMQKIYTKIKTKMFNTQTSIVNNLIFDTLAELKLMIKDPDEMIKLKAIKIFLDYAAKISPSVSESRSTINLEKGLL